MPESTKRKSGPQDSGDDRARKKSKGGSGGKWQTPHQKFKAASTSQRGGGKIEPGNAGIWVTCVKGKEGAATEELKGLFEEKYAECLHGTAASEFELATVQDEVSDIESSIQKEITSMAKEEGSTRLFTPIYLDLQCVLFFKTRPPIVPVDFVQRICEDAKSQKLKKTLRFVNRLTPSTMIARATEKSLEDMGKIVLRDHFQLAATQNNDGQENEQSHFSYAIRPTIRNHNTLKRGAVIDLLASLIGPNHKVDLTKPDKVVIVEIYQTICGMSVVGADWETLKRYNLAEIYQQALKPSLDSSGKTEAKATPGRVLNNEARSAADDRTIMLESGAKVELRSEIP